jgi:hypothetical protein
MRGKGCGGQQCVVWCVWDLSNHQNLVEILLRPKPLPYTPFLWVAGGGWVPGGGRRQAGRGGRRR